MLRKIDLIVNKIPTDIKEGKRLSKALLDLKAGLIFNFKDYDISTDESDVTYHSGKVDSLIMIVDHLSKMLQEDADLNLINDYLLGWFDGLYEFSNGELDLVDDAEVSSEKFNQIGKFNLFSTLIGTRGSLDLINEKAKVILRNALIDFDEENFDLADASEKVENFPEGHVLDNQFTAEVKLLNDDSETRYLDVFYLIDRTGEYYVTEVRLDE